MKSKLLFALPFSLACLAGATFLATGQDAAAPAKVKPLKALLVIGGCCHDYAKQKDILKAGLEERANLVVDICYSDDKSTKATFTCYEKDNWAEGYDVIIHDECSADIKDLAVVNRILDAHRKGTPGVNLHCAMHCYRTAPNVGKPVTSGTNDALWFDYLGLQSSGHGKQAPISITYSDIPRMPDWPAGQRSTRSFITTSRSTKAPPPSPRASRRIAKPWWPGLTNTGTKRPRSGPPPSATTTKPWPTPNTSIW